MQAVEDGDVLAARRLLDEGADPDEIAEDAVSALAIACRDGHELLVEVLLSTGADPDTRGIDDTTPLSIAIRRGDERIVERLLGAGASLSWDRHECTPMSTAIDADQYGILARLMQLRLPTGEPQSAFEHACALGNLAAVRQLWDAFRDKLTLGGPLRLAVASDNPAVVDLLLDAGAELDEFDLKEDFSPLMHAVMAGAQNTARTLISRGADVNAMTEWFVTPLSIARERGDREMFELLVAAGANADEKQRSFGPVVMPWGTYSSAVPDSDEENLPSALFCAVVQDDGEELGSLLQRGEDPFASPDRDTPSPFEEAFASGRGRFVRAMLAARPDRAPAMDGEWVNRAVRQSDPWILRMVLAGSTTLELPMLLRNAVVTERHHHLALLLDRCDDRKQMAQALIEAVQYGAIRCVRLLLDRGAPIEARGHQSYTVLHLAADRQSAEMVTLLLDRGADIEARGWMGQTPLWRAIGPTSTRTAAILLDRGADVHARGEWGSTLLHNAASCGWTETVALLLAHGADVNARDREGRTPLEVARGECVQLLSARV
jgi:ankyrin repeat protein